MKHKAWFVLCLFILLFALINFITTILKLKLGISEAWFNICISALTLIFSISLLLPNKSLSRILSFVLAMLYTFKYANDLGLTVFSEKNDFAIPRAIDLAVIYSLDLASVFIYTLYFIGKVKDWLFKFASFGGILVMIANLIWDSLAFSKNASFILVDPIYQTMTFFYYSSELVLLLIFVLLLRSRCGKIDLKTK